MRLLVLISIILCCSALGGCADGVPLIDESSAPFVGGIESGLGPVSDGPEIADLTVCGEVNSLCGHVVVPQNLQGAPRALVVALYPSLPPMGPPSAIVAEIDAPSLEAGEQYPVRIHPLLETGEFFIQVSLYMEGGGQWTPINGVDYTGASSNSVVLDGQSFEFDDIYLDLASGL